VAVFGPALPEPGPPLASAFPRLRLRRHCPILLAVADQPTAVCRWTM